MTKDGPARLLLLLLIVIAPFFEGGGTPAGLMLTQSLIFLILLTRLAGSLRERHLTLCAGPGWVASLLLLGAAVISFLQVDYLFGSFLALWNLVVYALMGWTLLLMRDDGFRGIPGAVAASSLLQAVLILVLPVPQNMTSSSTFANASQAAAYLNIGLFVAAAKLIPALRSRARVAVLWGVVILGNLSALLVLGSRGALLSLVVVGGIWLLSGPVPALRTRRARLVMGGGLAILAILSGLALVSRFERIGDSYRYDRVLIWKAGLTAAADHPVTGMGPGMFERRGYRYNFPLEREKFRYSKTPGSTHSTYLEALTELGTVGLAAVVILLATLIPPLWRKRNEAGAAALFATLFHGLVDTPFSVPAITLSLIALVVPLVKPSGPASSLLFARFSTAGREGRRLVTAVAGLTIFFYVAAVLVPYASYRSYISGVSASRPGRPARGLDRAVRLDPLNPLYVATRGEVSWNQEEPLTLETLWESHRDLLQAHTLDPGNHGYLVTLAKLHARACFEIGADEGSIARATRYYREAIALGRKDPRPYLELGVFLMAFGRQEEGMGYITEAIRIEPRFLGAHFALSRGLLETGRRDEAMTAFRHLGEVKESLTGYHPINGYEADLMRLDVTSLSRLSQRLVRAPRPLD